jgi:hypothetical protein
VPVLPVVRVERFAYVRVGVCGVAAGYVVRRGGGGEYDDGDGHQLRVALDLGKDLPAVDAGHVQV